MCVFWRADRIRTCDLWLRRPTLYPTELRAPGWCAPARAAPAFAARRAGGYGRAPSSEPAVGGNAQAARPGLGVGPGRSTRPDGGTVVDRGLRGQAAARRRRSAAGVRDALLDPPSARAAARWRNGRSDCEGRASLSVSTRKRETTPRNRLCPLVPDCALLQPYPGLPHDDSGGLREQG